MSVRQIPVHHAQGSYAVEIGRGLLSGLGDQAGQLAPQARKALLIADTGVPRSQIKLARQSLAQTFETHVAPRTPSESDKSLETYQGLQVVAAEASLERSDLIVALGGGVIGDIAGFVAATYRRGIRVIQCPSTLLSMVDASVGGKTGVNLKSQSVGLLKNALGAFHQPIAVLADTELLESLDDRVYRAGLGECIKHALIAGDWDDPELLSWTEQHHAEIARRDRDIVAQLIARNVAIKARVVRADERENAMKTRGRALLNLGHTFAHAIEPIPGLAADGGFLEHGEAVGLGLIAATATAAEMNRVPASQIERVIGLLQALGLPTKLAQTPDLDDLLTRMGHDKKALSGVLRMVLPSSSTTCETLDAPDTPYLRAGWSAVG